MPLIWATIAIVSLVVGDAYYFEGHHITSIIAHAKEVDAIAERQMGRVLHFKG